MSTQTKHSFPTVSMGKFTTLYFATMGWYAFYWFYMCWRAIRADSGKPLFPLFRSLFSVFFVHELFGYIQKQEDKENPFPWNASSTAWQFIGVSCASVVITIAFDYLKLGAIARVPMVILLLFAQFYVLYRVQLVINRIGADPFGRTNKKLSFENNLWIAFGLYLWGSFLYNSYLEATGQITVPSLFETQTISKDSSTT